MVKLLTGVGLHGFLLNYPSVTQSAIRSLLFALYHKFPKVRQTVSETLYNYLLMMEEPEDNFDSEEQYDETLVLLTETDWSMPIPELKEETLEPLFKNFKVAKPVKKVK